MSKYTKEDIIRMVREDDVEFIRMQFTDIFGQLKNVAITASQIEKAVNNEIMIDGSSIEGFVRINESDQYLRPDLDTFAILPWRPQHGKVARLICDVYNPDGTPFAGDPRGVLKKVLKKAADMGYSFNVGPEMEFFLFQTDEEGRPTTLTGDEAGYFDLGPLDHGESTRREICMSLEQMGFEIEASHHEVAAGQHEIDFKYADALTAADSVLIPMQCEYYALEGITDLIGSIRLCSSRLNSRLRIEGILLTMYDARANLTLQVENELRKFMPDKVYKTVIPRSVRLSEAPSHGLPGVIYDKNNRGSKAYLSLAEEFLSRNEGRQRWQ